MKPRSLLVAGMLAAGVVGWQVFRIHEAPGRSHSDSGETAFAASIVESEAEPSPLEAPIVVRESTEAGTRTALTQEPRETKRVRLHGHARDQNGAPIVGREIWMARTGTVKVDPDRGSFRERNGKEKLEVAGTGNDGAFELFAPEAGEWWLGIGPRGHRGAAEDLYRLAVKVAITPDERDREIDVLGYRGLVVCGSVVTPDGAPAPGAHVEASLSSDGPSIAHVEADEHGSYCVGPLPPGPCLVEASLVRRFLPSRTRRAAAGSTGVTLNLTEGGRCVVSIVRGRTGEPVQAELRCVLREGREDDGPWEEWIPEYKDVFDVQGLDEGVYDWIASTNSREIGVVRGVHVLEDGAAQRIVVNVEPSASLIIASTLLDPCPGPRGSWEVEIYSDGAFIQGDWIGAEASELRVVPPGPIRIRARYSPPSAELVTEEGDYWKRKGVRILDVVADVNETRRVELVSDGSSARITPASR